jgi:hypothetical protein
MYTGERKNAIEKGARIKKSRSVDNDSEMGCNGLTIMRIVPGRDVLAENILTGAAVICCRHCNILTGAA